MSSYLDYYKARYIDVATPQQLTADTEGDSLDNDIVLADGEQALVLTVTADQYVALLSAALNGASKTYPEAYIEAIWPLIKAGKLVFCEEVAACISDNPTVRQAIINLVSENGFAPTNEDTTQDPIPDSLWENEQIIPPGWVCDRDHAFGMARAILASMDNAATQLINALEVATNIPELISIFIDNVEVVSWFGSLLELAVWVQDEVLVTYEAAWSQVAVQDDLACSLYCLIYENCGLTVGMLDEWYQQELPSLPASFGDYAQILDWAIDLDLAVDKSAVVVWQWLGLQAVRFRSRWPGPLTAGLRSWSVIGALAADDVDGDWDILCTGCPVEWREIFDFAAGDLRWDNSNQPIVGCGIITGVEVAGLGWQGTYTNCGFGDPAHTIQIGPPAGALGGGNYIRRIIIEYAVADQAQNGVLAEFQARLGGAVTFNSGIVNDGADGTTGRIVIDVTGSHDNVGLHFRGAINVPEDDAYQKWISKIILSGVGVNPFA